MDQHLPPQDPTRRYLVTEQIPSNLSDKNEEKATSHEVSESSGEQNSVFLASINQASTSHQLQIEEQATNLQRLEETSRFGDYITKQYGLLKQILSFLTCPRDMWNAKLVHPDWSLAAEAVSQNPVVMSCSSSKLHLLNRPVLPKLIIYQGPTIKDYVINERDCMCNLQYFICPCTASGDNTLFVTFNREKNHYRERVEGYEGYKFWKSIALVLPSSKKIEVSKFTSSKIIYNKKEISDTLLNSYIGGNEPIKCLIMISKPSGSIKKKIWIKKLLEMIIERQGKTFAFGGGDIQKCTSKTGLLKSSDEKWNQPDLILIALRGSELTAHSAILSAYENRDITLFMQEFASRVGPHPEKGATRVAFIAQCVDRQHEPDVNKHESNEFERYFPVIPQFGFHAYGEYGMNSSSSRNSPPNGCSTSGEPSAKKAKINASSSSSSQNPSNEDLSRTTPHQEFCYSGTTSLVILTFNRI